MEGVGGGVKYMCGAHALTHTYMARVAKAADKHVASGSGFSFSRFSDGASLPTRAFIFSEETLTSPFMQQHERSRILPKF